MKRVVCLSTIVTSSRDPSSSSQVVDIYNSIIAYNIDREIVGSFIVSNDSLLLVMEGESTCLGNMVFKIRQDKRLKTFSIVLNESIDEPYFSNWGIKVLRPDSDGHNAFLENLSALLEPALELKAGPDLVRVGKFLTLKSMQAAETTAKTQAKKKEKVSSKSKLTASAAHPDKDKDFSGSTISLTNWPKPGAIKLNGEIIKICARLVGRPQRFEDLLDSGVVTSKESLNNALIELNKLAILKRHKVDKKPNLVGLKGGRTIPTTSKGTDRFSSVLKNFLSASKP